MTKLIVTADIHGSYTSWRTIKKLLNPDDTLLIAGDLFDTKYGNPSHVDFQPESIKKELIRLKQHFYYVYGNCDMTSFFPGFGSTLTLTIFNKKIFLTHGHRPFTPSTDIDIIIQGHTHLCFLERKGQQIFINPGSLTCPRNGMKTYGVIENTSASLKEIKTGNTLITIKL